MDRKTVEQFRLALFGRMVMGVSHEVDNHLSVVLGFAELLQVSGEREKTVLDGVGKILSAGEKIAAIIKQFSYYVRPHKAVVEPFSFSSVLSEIVLFSRYDLGRGNVTLEMPEMDPGIRLQGDSRDFALALLAVLLNGAEAMTGKGGKLAVGTILREGTQHITVTDEGPGILPGNISRIFEEGFTTKAEPLHTGMGLPVARHIISAMGGDVSVGNNPSGGCLATIRVPAS
jgi:two-component system NtrC family sensor kinase